jgi:hypothetical protein
MGNSENSRNNEKINTNQEEIILEQREEIVRLINKMGYKTKNITKKHINYLKR